MISIAQSRILVVVACIGAHALTANPATAHQPDSATINGSLNSSHYGPHTWTLTLNGLTYSYEFVYLNYMNPDVYYAWDRTRVYASSFDFEFQGPHAEELNTNVSDPLKSAGLQAGPVVELRKYTFWNNDFGTLDYAKDWAIEIKPLDLQLGLAFESRSYSGIEWPLFASDANGYPVLEPFTSYDALTYMIDNRSGSAYTMSSYGTLSVSSVGFSLPGDYNHDGTVDARDYVVWRNAGGTVGEYNVWRENFGQSSDSGALAGMRSVPEPGGLTLLTLAIIPAVLCRGRQLG